eukprot:CAMPEP_0183334186 /NCGR_PEP_ID=MMETSP0164_2-20130417/2860_1 /TAXON_ID=221442 /ORGANISM="Coccolithus pelagicus ssp braarudi, Strain PLY182g" /LENGTH=74 /DNA_ID=CAMNT_0025503281 /DNA_START=946 /DNA_END=1171 /DNA_ORIENTATION=+
MSVGGGSGQDCGKRGGGGGRDCGGGGGGRDRGGDGRGGGRGCGGSGDEAAAEKVAEEAAAVEMDTLEWARSSEL